MDQLEDLALVSDGAEGAVDHTHTAADALVVVDLGTAVLVSADGVHTASLGAGTLLQDDGVVGAGVHTHTAADALALVDEALAVDPGNSALGANLCAVLAGAALTAVADLIALGGAAVTSVGDDVYQGGIVVLLGDGAFHNTGGQGLVLGYGTQGQTHSQAQALTDDGTLQEDVLGSAGNDLIGQFLDAGVVAAFISQTGNFGEDSLTDAGYGSGDSSDLSHNGASLSMFLF